jgi:hypothetical protein
MALSPLEKKKRDRPRCSGACQHRVGWRIRRGDRPGAEMLVCASHIAWACRGAGPCTVQELREDEEVGSG